MTSTVLLGLITHIIHLSKDVWLMFLVFLRHDKGLVFPTVPPP